MALQSKIRWTARGRTWSSPTCFRRTSSMIPESKCQHPGLTNLVQEGPNAVLEEWSNCLAKKTRLTARGRTWSSPPSFVRSIDPIINFYSEVL